MDDTPVSEKMLPVVLSNWGDRYINQEYNAQGRLYALSLPGFFRGQPLIEG